VVKEGRTEVHRLDYRGVGVAANRKENEIRIFEGGWSTQGSSPSR